MTEEDAVGWIGSRFGGAAVDRLRCVAEMVLKESQHQNLISATSMTAMWSRHLVDSAQLIEYTTDVPGLWLDIGTGAGFPGVVVAALTDRRMAIVEPRKRRADFLQRMIDALGIQARIRVFASKVQTVSVDAAVVSARAVGSLEAIFHSAGHCANSKTRWVLPKGRKAVEEVAAAQRSWHGRFHVKQSVTDDASMIVIANKVSRR